MYCFVENSLNSISLENEHPKNSSKGQEEMLLDGVVKKTAIVTFPPFAHVTV